MERETGPRSSTYRTWVDRLSDFVGAGDILAAAWFSAALFLLALATSHAFGVAREFVRTEAIYLGHAGYFWVFAWLAWASRYVARLPRGLRSAFLVSDEDFDAKIRLTYARIYNWKSHVFGTIPGLLGASAFVFYSTRSGNLAWFPPWWSDGTTLVAKNVLLDVYYVVPIGVLVQTGASGIIAYTRFVNEISQLPMNPLIPLTRAKLRPITDFGLAAGLAWSVGVALFLLLFRSDFDLLAVAFLAIVSGLALVMILWPQWVIHKALERLRNSLLDTLSERTKPETLPESWDSPEALAVALKHVADEVIREQVSWAAEARTWIYEPKDIGAIVLTWLIPAGTFAYTFLIE